jgi:hypothetical protein
VPIKDPSNQLIDNQINVRTKQETSVFSWNKRKKIRITAPEEKSINSSS